MLPRERVEAAMDFRPPDIVPLRILPSAGGLYEHGEPLLELHRACGHDFGDLSGLSLPAPPPPEDFDADGRYHAFRTDAWGTRWEYRIFGIWGHPVYWPLEDLSKLEEYIPPPLPPTEGPAVEQAREAIAVDKRRYFTLGGSGSLFESLHSVRRFEDVLMDIAEDRSEIHRIADMLLEHALAGVEGSLARDVDGVCFGDDYGTQSAMLVSPATWRRFFRPRYEALFAPIKRAGKRIFFHVCGMVEPILEDFAQMGVDVIWPQLTAYDVPTLARRCRELGLTVELHPDRGDLMQYGTPEQIRTHVLRLLETFGTASGGSWLYVEIDPGFPFENARALFEVAMELRGQMGTGSKEGSSDSEAERCGA